MKWLDARDEFTISIVVREGVRDVVEANGQHVYLTALGSGNKFNASAYFFYADVADAWYFNGVDVLSSESAIDTASPAWTLLTLSMPADRSSAYLYDTGGAGGCDPTYRTDPYYYGLELVGPDGLLLGAAMFDLANGTRDFKSVDIAEILVYNRSISCEGERLLVYLDLRPSDNLSACRTIGDRKLPRWQILNCGCAICNANAQPNGHTFCHSLTLAFSNPIAILIQYTWVHAAAAAY
jgi:hypothetical protein